MRLEWGTLPPMYDQGLDRGVLYLQEGAVPWNGLVSIDEASVGEVNADHYFDGDRVHISHETGDFEATISAYTYPDVFAEYNGYSERESRRPFGLSYRTQRGMNDYRIHIVYNALIYETSKVRSSITDRTDPALFKWDIRAADVEIPGASPAAHLMLEAPNDKGVLGLLEDILYGTETVEPRLPDPAELIDLYEASTLLTIKHHGDGSYSASGPDDMVTILDDGRFSITAPTVFLLENDIFQVSSF